MPGPSMLICCCLQEVYKSLEALPKTSVKRALEQKWQSLSSMLYSSSCPPATDQAMTPVHRPTQCSALGFCICQPGPGQNAHRFHANLVSLFRPFWRVKANKKKKSDGSRHADAEKPEAQKKNPKSRARLLLEDCFLVLRLSRGQLVKRREAPGLRDLGWDDVEVPAAGGRQSAPALQAPPGLVRKQLSGAPRPTPYETLWYHIGFCNYTTYNFSVTKLHVEGIPDEGLPQHAQRLVVRDPAETDYCLKAFRRDLDFEHEWTAEFYMLYADRRVVVPEEMRGSVVEVVPCSLLPQLMVWKANAGIRIECNF